MRKSKHFFSILLAAVMLAGVSIMLPDSAEAASDKAGSAVEKTDRGLRH